MPDTATKTPPPEITPPLLTERALEDPRQILAWALDRYGERIALASSLGPQSLTIIDLLHHMGAGMRVLFLDTDLHFADTYALLARVEARYGIEIERVRPSLDLSSQARLHGAELWRHNPDLCCALRKTEPLRRALRGSAAWVTGIRRSHGASRAAARSVEWDAQFGLVKINPLVHWSRARVMRYLDEHDVPTNPLLEDGYPSVGCAPCTQRVTAILATTDERAGRWAGREKTECGLHDWTKTKKGVSSCHQ